MRFFGTQSAHTFLQFSWGWTILCPLHREMPRSWATLVSLVHLSSPKTGIYMTRFVICFGVSIVTCCPCPAMTESTASHPHLLLWHYMCSVHLQKLAMNSDSTKLFTCTNWKHISTFHSVSSSPATFKLTAWWCNTLTASSHGCVINIWLSHSDIHSRIMVFKVRAALTLFFETTLCTGQRQNMVKICYREHIRNI